MGIENYEEDKNGCQLNNIFTDTSCARERNKKV
jgi:hypothetical protein